MGFFLSIRFISLPKQKYSQKIYIYSNILSLYRKVVKPFYAQKFCTDKPWAIGGIFEEGVMKLKIAAIKINLTNKYIKLNKIPEHVVVSIGLQSLFPRKSKFALKK